MDWCRKQLRAAGSWPGLFLLADLSTDFSLPVLLLALSQQELLSWPQLVGAGGVGGCWWLLAQAQCSDAWESFPLSVPPFCPLPQVAGVSVSGQVKLSAEGEPAGLTGTGVAQASALQPAAGRGMSGLLLSSPLFAVTQAAEVGVEGLRVADVAW